MLTPFPKSLFLLYNCARCWIECPRSQAAMLPSKQLHKYDPYSPDYIQRPSSNNRPSVLFPHVPSRRFSTGLLHGSINDRVFLPAGAIC